MPAPPVDKHATDAAEARQRRGKRPPPAMDRSLTSAANDNLLPLMLRLKLLLLLATVAGAFSTAVWLLAR